MADDWAIGSIQYLGRNTIDIFDEKLRMDRRFTYFGSQRELQVGERVRIFFDPDSRVVRIIKKITPLEYRQDGQNLGYIHHK
jgi:hypothetical protein